MALVPWWPKHQSLNNTSVQTRTADIHVLHYLLQAGFCRRGHVPLRHTRKRDADLLTTRIRGSFVCCVWLNIKKKKKKLQKVNSACDCSTRTGVCTLRGPSRTLADGGSRHVEPRSQSDAETMNWQFKAPMDLFCMSFTPPLFFVMSLSLLSTWYQRHKVP